MEFFIRVFINKIFIKVWIVEYFYFLIFFNVIFIIINYYLFIDINFFFNLWGRVRKGKKKRCFIC